MKRRSFTTNIFFLIILSGWIIGLPACQAPAISEADKPVPVASTRAYSSGETVRVGVLAIRSAVAANAQYGPIIAYLEEEIGRPFELVPVDQESQFTEVEQEALDFTLNNPLAAVQLRRLYNTEFLATLKRANTGTQFSALIVVSGESDIYTVEDLYNKKGTCVAFQTAAAGCAFQVFHLLEQGFDPYKDFASFVETPSQDNIVLGVLNGTYDVGFIRTGQLERMVKDGTLLDVNELRIIDQMEDNFYFPHTTRLYPEWPFAALAQTDPELKIQVQEALLAIPADHPAMINAGAVGFESNVDYSPLDALIERLQLRSWDVQP